MHIIEIQFKGGPFDGEMWLTRSQSGTCEFTLRGETGHYDKQGIWRASK